LDKRGDVWKKTLCTKNNVKQTTIKFPSAARKQILRRKTNSTSEITTPDTDASPNAD
jgi:hypothetical protein